LIELDRGPTSQRPGGFGYLIASAQTGVLMSALGQKPTYAPQQAMSAFPPIATAKADLRKRSCPLYPRKQTCAVRLGMSAKGQ